MQINSVSLFNPDTWNLESEVTVPDICIKLPVFQKAALHSEDPQQSDVSDLLIQWHLLKCLNWISDVGWISAPLANANRDTTTAIVNSKFSLKI